MTLRTCVGWVLQAYNFMVWLMNRPEKEIVISTHSAWLFSVFNTVLECDDSSLAAWFVNGEMRSVQVHMM